MSQCQCNYDICIQQGVNFYWIIEYYDKIDGVETPVDLTGYDVIMTIRKTAKSSTLLDQYSIDGGQISLDEENGKIIINVPHAATEAYPDEFKGVYNLNIISPSNFKERLVEGNVIVSQEVEE